MGGVLLGLHGVFHLVVYPVSVGHRLDGDSERSWIPVSLPNAAVGWLGRALLVISAGLFIAAGVSVASPRWSSRGPRLCVIAGAFSLLTLAIIWTDLTPRPEALWCGPVISAVVVAAGARSLIVRRRGTTPTPSGGGPIRHPSHLPPGRAR